MGGFLNWWDGVELWLSGLGFVAQTVIVMPVVLALAFGMAVLLDSALGQGIRLLRRVGVTDPESIDSYRHSGGYTALRRAFALTDRETDVLLWIAAGKSNRDIADILSLSPRTVNKYLDQIYLKISVENRASAAAKAVRVLSGL